MKQILFQTPSQKGEIQRNRIDRKILSKIFSRTAFSAVLWQMSLKCGESFKSKTIHFSIKIIYK